LGAGALLAVHFALWLPSLRLTSVTASTALVTTAPVWTVLLGRMRGAAVPGAAWAGAGLALAGVLTVTGIDAGHDRDALVGDVLALAAGMASAGYVVVGERTRRTTSTAVYTLVAYATCAVLLLPPCVVSGTPLTGWGWRTWVELLVLTFAAQMLGHSLLNAALPVVGATPLSLSILLEVPGAALVAWLWLGSAPPWTVVPGAALVLVGLVVVIRAGRRRPSGLPDGGATSGPAEDTRTKTTSKSTRRSPDYRGRRRGSGRRLGRTPDSGTAVPVPEASAAGPASPHFPGRPDRLLRRASGPRLVAGAGRGQLQRAVHVTGPTMPSTARLASLW
jgi:drug/metabolite transporter (DMT)-like permease